MGTVFTCLETLFKWTVIHEVVSLFAEAMKMGSVSSPTRWSPPRMVAASVFWVLLLSAIAAVLALGRWASASSVQTMRILHRLPPDNPLPKPDWGVKTSPGQNLSPKFTDHLVDLPIVCRDCGRAWPDHVHDALRHYEWYSNDSQQAWMQTAYKCGCGMVNIVQGTGQRATQAVDNAALDNERRALLPKRPSHELKKWKRTLPVDLNEMAWANVTKSHDWTADWTWTRWTWHVRCPHCDLFGLELIPHTQFSNRLDIRPAGHLYKTENVGILQCSNPDCQQGTIVIDTQHFVTIPTVFGTKDVTAWFTWIYTSAWLYVPVLAVLAINTFSKAYAASKEQ